MAEEQKKFYLLYNNKNQEKLLSSAKTQEIILEESQYYSAGSWFEYDDNDNVLTNEVPVTGIKFPKEPKERKRYTSTGSNKKANFKWVD